ncbi:ribonuclease Z [Arthrobacter sp. ISL-30]|uniref:ribonuclease Z n=1 Tax=Arthrobacter sp. ISL-30 TaxID=2819109 RepID=UPI001BE8FD31|nr:ribonuclease Z [Arthrobacter sp. ISL-30]MBT2512670.1 ribonuclease Z [Arthrobacter sp. ISL-30]
MRELVVLGTASQVPTRSRNHNGYFLRWDDEGILFDPGDGTQRQMIHAGVSASEVTRICITHVHGDHCYGLPGVLSRLALDRVAHPVRLHYPASGEDIIWPLVAVASPGIDLRLYPHDEAGAIAPGVEVRPLLHRIETYGYRLTAPSQSFAFVMDTAPCAGAEELADGVDLLVAESTFSDDDGNLAAQFRHLTAGQAGTLAAAAGVGTLALIHRC